MNAVEEREYIVRGFAELRERLSRVTAPDPAQVALRATKTRLRTQRYIHLEYQAADIEPRYTGDGLLISLSLAMNLATPIGASHG